MKLFKKAPREYDVILGDPTTINGNPTSASTPHEILTEIYDIAVYFPITITVTGSGSTHVLEMDEEKSTRPLNPDDGEKQTEDEVPAPSTEYESIESLVDHGAAEEEPTESHEQADSRSDKRWITRRAAVLSAATAFLLIGLVVTAFAVLSGDERSDAESAETAVLPEDATPLVINGEYIVATISDRTELALYATATGEQVQSWDLSTEDGARVMSTPDALAVDTTNGEVLLVTGETQEVYDGALNTRGSAPVIVDGEQYRSMGGPEESRDLPEGAAIFAGATEGAFLAESPATVITPEEDEIDLDSPEGDHTLENFLAADDERIVTRWVDDDDSAVLAIHDPATGELQDTLTVETETFSVVGGTVLVGESNYLDGGEISPLCEDSEVITGTIMCPTDEGWESLDGELTTDTDLVAISGEARVTTDHTIETTED